MAEIWRLVDSAVLIGNAGVYKVCSTNGGAARSGSHFVDEKFTIFKI